MPTYVYRCTECEHEFEVFAKMSDRPRARKCPICGERAQRQISGGAGFLFKGDGFYITDYRSEEYRSKAKADSEAPKEAAAGTLKDGAGGPEAKKDVSEDAPANASGDSPTGKAAAKPVGRKRVRKPRDAPRE